MTLYKPHHRAPAVMPHPADLALQGIAGAGWYDAAHETIKAYAAAHGHDVQRVADILAITSPRQTVARNVQLAHAYLTDRSVRGVMKGIRAALDHYEQTGEIRGPKTGAFARALTGSPDAVVIDVWMYRALGYDWPSMTPTRYRQACDAVRSLAATLRYPDGTTLTPAETQAAVWCGVRLVHRCTTHAPLVMEA